MTKHVKFAYPDREDDHSVHLGYDSQFTLCGLAFEGVGRISDDEGRTLPLQGFETTTDKVTCWRCIQIVKYCKTVKSSELKQS